MAIFGPIVQVPPHFAAIEISQLAHRCRVGFQAVGNDGPGSPMTFQGLLQKTQGGRFISCFRNVALQDLAFVIHGAPKIIHLAIDPNVDLVNMPPPMPKPTHPAYPLAANICREHRAKSILPQPYCLMAQIDTPFEQQVFHVPQR